MSLFQCEKCGCVENTACAAQGFKPMNHLFDYTGIEEFRENLLCSACGPAYFRNGSPTGYGEWHHRFVRTYLPLGMFETNHEGNLAHKETGETDYRKYALTSGGSSDE